jgi:hypothetical protein
MMIYVVIGVMCFVIGFIVSYLLFSPVHTALKSLENHVLKIYKEITSYNKN